MSAIFALSSEDVLDPVDVASAHFRRGAAAEAFFRPPLLQIGRAAVFHVRIRVPSSPRHVPRPARTYLRSVYNWMTTSPGNGAIFVAE